MKGKLICILIGLIITSTSFSIIGTTNEESIIKFDKNAGTGLSENEFLAFKPVAPENNIKLDFNPFAQWKKIFGIAYQSEMYDLPDLICEDIMVEYETFSKGSTFDILFIFKNIGSVDITDSFNVYFFFDGISDSYTNINGLAAEQQIGVMKYDFTWPDDLDWHTISGYADYTELIEESNEGNNRRDEDFKATPKHTITFYTDPTEGGDISWSNGLTNGIYSNGDSITVFDRDFSCAAEASDGYDFSHWTTTGGVTLDGSTWSTSGTLSDSDGTLKAWFSIENQPPNIPNQPSGPTSGIIGETYTYTTITTDPENNDISYGWDWDGNGVVDEWDGIYPYGTTCETSHSWSSPGIYEIKVKARDVWDKESDWSDSLSVTITEVGNNPPSAPSDPSGPVSLEEGESGMYSTSGTDPDDDQVQYRFDWDADGGHDYSSWTTLVASGQTDSMSHSWSSAGTYTVKAQAKDEHGATSGWSNGFTVAVGINNPPNTPDTPSGPTSLIIGESGTYSTSATDPDGDKIKYHWDWGDGNGEYSDLYPSGEVVSMLHSWDVAGTYYVAVRSWDEYNGRGGKSDGLAVTVTSSSNNPPNTPDTPSGMTSGETGIMYTYTTTTTDPNNDNIKYGWDWDNDNVVDEWTDYYSSGATCDITHSWSNPGTYSIKVKAKDADNAQSSFSQALTVVITGQSQPEPDLVCSGTISWPNAKPETLVSGEFTVANQGDPGSLLDWEISSYPEWGTDWFYTINAGDDTDLTPEDGEVTVGISVTTPDEKNSNYSGYIIVENKDDPSDTCEIPISLTVPKTKASQFPLFHKFFTQLLNRFPMLEQILQPIYDKLAGF